MSDNAKWWSQMAVTIALALFGTFKGEILAQLQSGWTALTASRLIFWLAVLYGCALLALRFVVQPIHRKIDAIGKAQTDAVAKFEQERDSAVLKFNQTTGTVLQSVDRFEANLEALTHRVETLESHRVNHNPLGPAE